MENSGVWKIPLGFPFQETPGVHEKRNCVKLSRAATTGKGTMSAVLPWYLISGGMFPPIEVFIFILLILVGGLEHVFSIQLGIIIIPTGPKSIIFQRGRAQPPTRTWQYWQGNHRMEPQHAPFRMDS